MKGKLARETEDLQNEIMTLVDHGKVSSRLEIRN